MPVGLAGSFRICFQALDDARDSLQESNFVGCEGVDVDVSI